MRFLPIAILLTSTSMAMANDAIVAEGRERSAEPWASAARAYGVWRMAYGAEIAAKSHYSVQSKHKLFSYFIAIDK